VFSIDGPEAALKMKADVQPAFIMNLKILVRAVFFLAVLFLMLYVGLTNRHSIDYYFAADLQAKITQPAAIMFFAFFAVGVLTGVMVNLGKGSGKSSSGSFGSSKKAK
jgi:uncharacterized integral membrane protein